MKGLGNKNKREHIFEWLKYNSFDICLLQETHSTTKVETEWENEWGGKAYFSGFKSNSEGISIMINKKLSFDEINYTEIIKGKLQALTIQANNKEITLLNLYGPNSDDSTLFNTLEKFMEENEDCNFIVGGDFNTVLDINKDKKNGRTDTHKKKREKITEIIDTYELIDIWRSQHQDILKYTWHSNNKPRIFCRLDYFLISENILNCVEKSDIKTGYKSDHSVVTLNINLSTTAKGPGVFKINNSILLDTEYQSNIRNSITDIVEINKETNPNTLWELIKGTIRNESIRYSTLKKKQQKLREDEIKKALEQLENNLQNHTDDPNIEEITKSITNLKEELNEIVEHKINGFIIRSKAEIAEYNEKGSKYFSSLERKKAEKKTINQLNINGKLSTNQEDIFKELKRFYSKLYDRKECSSSSQNFFRHDINKLNQTEKESCEGILTEFECAQALLSMKNGKSPGSDGITTEFYKIFWPDIKLHLLNSLNYSYQNNKLTELQSQSLITLLPKTGKDIKNVENWRPISLLNIDYKIATKTLANRMKAILDSIISREQTGFMKGRYIGENVRLLFETLEYVEENNMPSILFFADFEKAFDSIDHHFMYEVLEFFNFGDSFIKWIKLFYKDAKSCICNNGHMTDFFQITRGVRQGCPLSPYLFIVCIELLSNNITQNKNIKGIDILGVELKQTLFADDGTFITDGTQQSFENLIITLDNFSNILGLKLNSQKCKILRAGSLKHSICKFMNHKNFDWNSHKAETLGMIFSNRPEENVDLNLNPKLSDFINCLKRWQHRKLSLMGKITVVKTFALPKLIYPLTVLQNPSEEQITLIKKKIFEFIWDKKPDKIKRKLLTQDYEKGGLKLLDFDSFLLAIKASWVKKIFDEKNNGTLKEIYLKTIHKCGGKLILECNTSVQDILKLFHRKTFIQTILKSWILIRKPETKEHINQEIIWNNKYIKVGNETIYFKLWYNKGIKHIQQIYDFRYQNFFKFEELVHLFDLPRNEIYRYNQLITSIPKRWKERLKNETPSQPYTEKFIEDFFKSQRSVKFLYDYKVRQEPIPEIKSEIKWQNSFEGGNFNWKIIYTTSFKCSIDQKIRNFQYKYLMQIIPTNVFLFKCNLVQSILCDFCNMYVETTKHLFWECSTIKQFWLGIEVYLTQKGLNIKLDYKSISLGTQNINIKHNLINLIIILSKYYIHRCKYTKQNPNIEHFKRYLSNEINVEKQIALNHDKVEQHNIKWQPFT